MEADDACGCRGGAKTNAVDTIAAGTSAKVSRQLSELHFYAPGTREAGDAWCMQQVWVQASDSWTPIGLSIKLKVAPLEVLDVLPLPASAGNTSVVPAALDEEENDSKVRREQSGAKIQLKAGVRYVVVFRAIPLLEVQGASLALRADAIKILRKLPAPLRVVAFVGPGRCGKSYTLSRLAEDDLPAFAASVDARESSQAITTVVGDSVLGPDAAGGMVGCTSDHLPQEKFPVGKGADPLTAGIDFCILPSASADDGVLLMLDCEGSDNPCDDNAARCEAVVSLAVSAASQLVQCDSTTVKESTLEDLATALKIFKKSASLRPISAEVRLCVLIIACRFAGIDESYLEKRILADKEGDRSRSELRGMIRAAFKQRRVRSLPHLAEASAYEAAIRQLRAELWDFTPPVQSADGTEMDGASFCDGLEAAAKEIARISPQVEETTLQAALEAAAIAEADFKEALCGAAPAHFVSAKDLEPFRPGGDQHQSALAHFDLQIGATEEVQTSMLVEQRQRLEERLEVLFHRACAKNEEYKAEDLRRSESLAAKLAEDFAASLPDRGHCWDDQELESWGAPRIAELEAVFVRTCARGQRQESSIHCQEAVEEGRRSLRLGCWDLWQRRVQENSHLRQALEAAAERARLAALETCKAEVPCVDGYLCSEELLRRFEPVRRVALQRLEELLEAEELLAGSGDSGTFESSLRERTAGALAVALQRLHKDLLEASEACRLQELEQADELANAAFQELLQRLPALPLQAPLGEAQLAELEVLAANAQSRLNSQLDDLHLRCSEAPARARAALAEKAAAAVEKLRSESLRKAQAEVQLQQALQAALKLFEHGIEQKGREFFLDDEAWAKDGLFAKARDAAEASFAAACEAVLETSPEEDPWYVEACKKQQAVLGASLHERLKVLECEAAELRRAEDLRASAAAERACQELAASLPDRPLQRVLTSHCWARLEESTRSCCSHLEDECSTARCTSAWTAAKERVATETRRLLDELRTSNEALKVQREDSLRRASERQHEALVMLCDDLLKQQSLGDAQVNAASAKMQFLLGNFEDEAKHIVGDGVLVLRGEWEEELLRTLKRRLASQLEAEVEKVSAVARRQRSRRWGRLALILLPVLLAFLALRLGNATNSSSRSSRNAADAHTASSVEQAAMETALPDAKIAIEQVDADKEAHEKLEIEKPATLSSTAAEKITDSAGRVAGQKKTDRVVASQAETTGVTGEEALEKVAAEKAAAERTAAENDATSAAEKAAGEKAAAEKAAAEKTAVEKAAAEKAAAEMAEKATAEKAAAEKAAAEKAAAEKVAVEKAAAEKAAAEMAEKAVAEKAAAEKAAAEKAAAEKAAAEKAAFEKAAADKAAEKVAAAETAAAEKAAAERAAASAEKAASSSNMAAERAAAEKAMEAAAAAAARKAAEPQGSPSDSSCSDENDFCVDWASAGACEANAAFMAKHCRRSCGACDR
eukprot:TRINITY_DN10117_c0_g1_i1.p1 TRINITY_DN10117_c0_g1~~TRINITY_DN10117_c0_g1_i1.p1  ORF type:complete len:1465 (+),score=485.72 TRINITY_DN10117_c0_g1_i1:37-4431(+)